jgi:hypothetical protein
LAEKYWIEAIQIERQDRPMRVLDRAPAHVGSVEEAKQKVRELFQLARFPMWKGPTIEAVRLLDDHEHELHRWDDVEEFLKVTEDATAKVREQAKEVKDASWP